MGQKITAPTYSYFRTDIPKLEGHSNELMYDMMWLIPYSHLANKDHPDTFVEKTYKGSQSIIEVFEKSAEEFKTQRYLGTRAAEKEGRPYEWKSFEEVNDLRLNLAKGKSPITAI